MSTATIARKSPSENAPGTQGAILAAMRMAERKLAKVEPEVERTMVEDLRPNRPVGMMELLVLRRYPRRFVNGAKWKGNLAAACARDESGLVGLVLWGDQVEQVRSGDVIRIEGGWCRTSRGERVVSTGRTGKLRVLSS